MQNKEEEEVNNLPKVEKVVEESKDIEVTESEVVNSNINYKEKDRENVSLMINDNSNPFGSELPNTNKSFGLISDTANSLIYMKQIARELITSRLCPLTTESDVITAIITGNQYGFPFMTSVTNIYPINGKTMMSVHLHRALILKHKILFNKIYDYEAIYQFGLLTEDKTGFDLVDRPNPKGGGIIKVPKEIKVGILATKPENYGIIKEIDRITKYSFTRYMKMPTGDYEKLTVYSEYKMSDASKAGLLEKDNWEKHPPRMLDARAFGIGSKEIGADILLGVYTINELADEYNLNYTVSEGMEETVITN